MVVISLHLYRVIRTERPGCSCLEFSKECTAWNKTEVTHIYTYTCITGWFLKLLKQVSSAFHHSFKNYTHKRPGRSTRITLYYTVIYLLELHNFGDLLLTQYFRTVHTWQYCNALKKLSERGNIDSIVQNIDIGWPLAPRRQKCSKSCHGGRW